MTFALLCVVFVAALEIHRNHKRNARDLQASAVRRITSAATELDEAMRADVGAPLPFPAPAAPASITHRTVTSATPPPYDEAPRRRAIGMAARSKWKVEIVYCDKNGEWSQRVISSIQSDPPHWFSGYCHLRNEARSFRLDRTLAVEVQHDNNEIRAKYRV